ncbi:2-isopropylmalate synthase [Puniceicoccus vermicola]|uniref:2-isopropylmalate synthase n=1 Tax=Puniceicoccus vermicola TaxID=388746 RepID=A0A7X1AVM6_9BACT|nr:2-isopropylmalate synthase [Puniceicoccus vermicola]MBC2600677.1 2-isopropylmalate synthase [Puniceicoccus vermicola]
MLKEPHKKYRPFEAIDLPDRQWPDRRIEHAPIWCSVDLRDGNQALAIPMSVTEKLRMFELLVEIGFKEIEVGFPAASQVEYDFMRKLIDEDRIPDDVTIQVLVQARDHLIDKTFESLRGVNRAVLHLYNSVSPSQRRITFNLSKEEVKAIAINGAKRVSGWLPRMQGSDIRVQYSPESFSSTEMDYALEVCEAVCDVIQPTPERKMILNLPGTVEVATPNIHADQIEWFCRNISRRDSVIISLHTHNDRGTGVAATELGLMAGAERVEGTLFGNGERTGNLDIVTVALNLYSQGVVPQLNLEDLDRIREVYEANTRMEVHPRHPYGGDLVFTAFSGSHQDAIKKGFDLRDKSENPDEMIWDVPYLTIDPHDIGRNYEAIIRINSQSGKGGVAHVLSRDFGFKLPKPMQPEVGARVNHIADSRGVELAGQDIYDIFREEFVNVESPLRLVSHEITRSGAEKSRYQYVGVVSEDGQEVSLKGEGNGPINAFVHAMENQGWKDFRLQDYEQHAIGHGSATSSAAYIVLERQDGQRFYGCGLDTNIEEAGLLALLSAVNRARKAV